MTLRSLKKRRTTQRNTLPRIISNLARWFRRSSPALACAVFIGAGTAAEPPETSPLDRLKERSADARWQEIRDQWVPSRAGTRQSPPSQAAPETFGSDERPSPLFDGEQANEIGSAQAGSDATSEGSRDASSSIDDSDASVGDELTPPNAEWRPMPPVVEAAPGRETMADPPPYRPFPGEPVPVPAPAQVIPVPVPYERDLETAHESGPADTTAPPVTERSPDLADETGELPSGETPDLLIPPKPEWSQPRIRVAQQLPAMPLPSDDERATIFRPIASIQPDYDYSPTGTEPHQYLCPQPPGVPDDRRMRCPDVRPLPGTGSVERDFAPLNFQWCASNLYHNPLYFEDVSLERYGHAYPPLVQPAASLAKFGLHVIGLPYQMAMHPVWHEHYALGYYLPGDPAPTLHYRVPLNQKAIVAAAGVYTGLVFIFP